MSVNLLPLFLIQTPRNSTDYQGGSEVKSTAFVAKQPEFRSQLCYLTNWGLRPAACLSGSVSASAGRVKVEVVRTTRANA